MQNRGVPTVAIVTEQFVSLAKNSAKALGYPDLPIVVVPHPFETLPRERIRQIAEEKVEEIIQKVSHAKEQAIHH
ncbi:MAG: hypothetical protein AAB502_04985 [Chloroflexota bacterium]